MATLGRLDDEGKAMFSVDGFPNAIGRFTASPIKVGIHKRLAWCDADVAEDVLAELPHKRMPGMRKHFRKVRSVAFLASHDLPVWIAAAASVGAPKWMRAPYRVEQLPDVQERIVAAKAMLARRP